MSKLVYKTVIFVIAIIIALLGTAFFGKQFNPYSKLSSLPGEVAGVFTSKFSAAGISPIGPDNVKAQVSSPYQNVSGPVAISGNVGIGAVNPQAPLEISDNSGNSLRFFPGSKSQIRTDAWNSAIEMYTTQSSGTNNFNQLYLASSGNVGIGLNNPSSKLQVNGTITAPTFAGNATSANYQSATGNSNDWVQSFQQTPPHSTSFREMSAGGPSGTWWFVENMRHSNGSNYWGRQIAWGWEDNLNKMYTRNIQAGVFGGWVEMISSANIGSQSVNYANSAGSAPASDVPAQSKYLNQWVNTDSGPTFANINTGLIIAEPYFFQFQPDANLVIKNRYDGFIMWAASYTGSAWKSDIRLKENIKPLNNSLDKLNQLQAVSFDWKEHKPAPYHDNAPLGFIAQQLEKIYPELVYEDNLTGMKMIDYGGLTAPIIKSIQELDNKISLLWNMTTSSSQKIDILTNQVSSQQAEIDALKAEIETLKNR